MINDKITAVGSLVITLTGHDGSIKDERQFKNLVVDLGKAYIAGRVGPNATTAMSHMAVGTGVTAPAAANTTLVTEVGTRSALTVTQTGATITYAATFAAGNGTGALTEAGIFNGATGATMLCRTTFAAVNKGASDTISITWTVTIQ